MVKYAIYVCSFICSSSIVTHLFYCNSCMHILECFFLIVYSTCEGDNSAACTEIDCDPGESSTLHNYEYCYTIAFMLI